MPQHPPDGRHHSQTVWPNINGLSVRTKVWLERDGRFVIGEGGLDLLEAIVASGSLRAAARCIGWSYRHAWGYLRNAERLIGIRLTQPVPGKGRARGTDLTESGQALRCQLATLGRRAARACGVARPGENRDCRASGPPPAIP